MRKSILSCLFVVLAYSVGLGQINQPGGGGGSGTVSANNGSAGALANYAAAGGSTTVGPDATLLDNGTRLVYSGTVGLQFPSLASCATPELSFTGHPNFGIDDNGATGIVICSNGAANFAVGNIGAFPAVYVANTIGLGFASGNVLATSPDTAAWRDSAGVMDFGSGTASTTTTKLQASGYISKGTKFTQDTGCGTVVTSSGGATAGKFTTVGSTSCTTVITMGDSATAPNGWQCSATDVTTVGDAANPHMTTSNATTVTIATGTIASGDVISFGCIGY